MAETALARFLEKLSTSLQASSFVKLTLSQPRAAEPGLRNVYARMVELREGVRVSLVHRYDTREVTTNLTPERALETLGDMLPGHFERAHLFTTTGDWQLRCDARGEGTLKASRPAFAVAPPPRHDRLKPQLIAPTAAFLRALGVTNNAGEARPGMADKLRQIERFAEILGHLLDDSPLREARELRAVDVGSGKGYLTFATCEFFRGRGVAVDMTGIEARKDLVQLTQRVALEVGVEHLRFVHGEISDAAPGSALDLLLALHACDTATDDAIHHGIRAGASLIVTAPCCHKELRPQIAAPAVLQEVLRHGILKEREAAILTDAIRALLLEIHGYDASVFEFISTEHTGRNLMIAAHKRVRPRDAGPLRERLHELLRFYDIREQRLARSLGEL